MLTTWFGWRSVFLINVPAGIAAGLTSPRMVPGIPRPAAARRQPDLAGAALAVAGLVTLVSAISGASAHGWASARTLLLTVALPRPARDLRRHGAGFFRTDLPAGWLTAACIALVHSCSDAVRAGSTPTPPMA